MPARIALSVLAVPIVIKMFGIETSSSKNNENPIAIDQEISNINEQNKTNEL